MKSHFAIWFLFCTVSNLFAQGYIVPSGVTVGGYTAPFGYAFDVKYDPTNSYTTSFFMKPIGKTLPTIYTNTFQFGAIVDVSVRVFLVSSNQSISQQSIQSGSYTELTFNSYVFDHNSPFYGGAISFL